MKFQVGQRVLMENILNKHKSQTSERIQYVPVTILKAYDKTYRVEGINSQGVKVVKPYVYESKLKVLG